MGYEDSLSALGRQIVSLIDSIGIRVLFIQNGIYASGICKPATGIVDRTRLDGVKILEVACGGGILCEELARLGADVIGLDINSKVIETAKKHQALDSSIKNNLNYICESIHQYQKDNFENYDAVVIFEVIEHVPNEEKEEFLTSSIKALRPGGHYSLVLLVRRFLAE